MTESRNTPNFMTSTEILASAENDYHGFVSKVKNGIIAIEQVEKAIMSLGDAFGNVDVEVRTDTIDYLWMGFTLRGENDFTPKIQEIAKFAETLTMSALNDPKRADASMNTFKFEVETGHVMEPSTISQNFVFAYSDSLLQWQVANDKNVLVLNGEVDETADELVAHFGFNFNSVTVEYDRLNQLV